MRDTDNLYVGWAECNGGASLDARPGGAKDPLYAVCRVPCHFRHETPPCRPGYPRYPRRPSRVSGVRALGSLLGVARQPS